MAEALSVRAIWQRHKLVRVRPTAWRAVDDLPTGPDTVVLRAWAQMGRPFIVRRFLPGEGKERIPLGVPLPPCHGKRRIAFCMDADDVTEHLPPISLRSGRDLAPRLWTDTIEALLDVAARYGCEPVIAGSLLWQGLTGLAYLTARSDLDLIWPSAAACPALLHELAAIESCSPMRLDGEIVSFEGNAVNWRELYSCLQGASDTVLVKSMSGACVRRIDEMLKMSGVPRAAR